MLLATVVCVVLGVLLVCIGLHSRHRAEVELSTNAGTRIHRLPPRKITVIPRTEWQQRVRSIEVHNPPPRYGRHSIEHLLTDTVEMVGLVDLLRRVEMPSVKVSTPKIEMPRPDAGRYFWIDRGFLSENA